MRRITYKEREKQISFAKRLNAKKLKDFSGTSPTPFIGRFNYPDINVGFLTVPYITDEAWQYDAPQYWAQNGFNIPKLLDYRLSLVNVSKQSNVKMRDKHIEYAKEIALAKRAVDVEVIVKKIALHNTTNNIIAPYGPTATVQKAQITSNPRIDTRVQKIVDDDIGAAEGMQILYKKGFDESFLSRILSVGTLGINKKLVPTRWSITAVDDTISKRIVLNDFKEHDYSVFYANYLSNHILIMITPGAWSYELIEVEMKSWNKGIKRYTADHEYNNGRKTYAQNCAGGYYASRLAVTEYLKKDKRVGSVIVLRYICEEYDVGMGVWVVREACRKAVQNKLTFSSYDLMKKYAGAKARMYGFPFEEILNKALTRTVQTKLFK